MLVGHRVEQLTRNGTGASRRRSAAPTELRALDGRARAGRRRPRAAQRRISASRRLRRADRDAASSSVDAALRHERPAVWAIGDLVGPRHARACGVGAGRARRRDHRRAAHRARARPGARSRCASTASPRSRRSGSPRRRRARAATTSGSGEFPFQRARQGDGGRAHGRLRQGGDRQARTARYSAST